MAVTADKVVVELELKDGQYLAKVRSSEAAFSRSQQNTARAAEDTERRIRASSAGIASTFKSLATSLAAGASAAAILKMADGYTSLQNRLKATGLEGENLIKIENQLFDAANKNGIAIDSVAQLYQRASLAQKSLGASSDQIIALTNGVSAALRVQGVSATQASGPLLQLGQALGGGTVRAEELNSLLEGTPILLQAAANGSQRFGGDINKLSAAIRDGKVSSKELFDALIAGLPAVERQAEALPKTVGQAFEILNNQLGRFVGQTDQGLSATARLAAGIEALANNLNTIVPALAVISGIFATRYVAGLVAAGLAEEGFIAKARQATVEAIANERAKTEAVAIGTRARTAALTAESIALRRQVDTGRNAAGQFISQAAAQRQLTETNRALTASMGPATAATLKNTTAFNAATVGARSFGNGLLALAGGPIGATILAVGALVAGIGYLIRENSQAEISAKALQRAEEAAAPIKTRLKTLTDELATASRQRAAAIREEINEIINLQRVELARLGAKKKAAEDAARAGGGTGGVDSLTGAFGGEVGTSFGRQVNAQNARTIPIAQLQTREVKEANAAYDAQKTIVDALTGSLVEAEKARAALAAPPAPAGPVAAARAASAAAKEEVDTLADDLARLQESLLTDAERAAKILAEQASIISAAVNRGLITPLQGAQLTAATAGQGLQAFEAREPLKQLGNEGAEIGKLIAEGAAAQVESWRGVARDFVDVLASDNIWEAAGRKFRDAAFNQLEDMLTNIFAALSKGGDGSGNWLSTIASAAFGGNRASGGQVRAGMSYNVGERGTEKFVPTTNGYIIPNMKNATAKAGMSGTVRIMIGEGEMFSARVTEIAGPLSVQTAMTGVAYSQDQAANASKRRGQSFI